MQERRQRLLQYQCYEKMDLSAAQRRARFYIPQVIAEIWRFSMRTDIVIRRARPDENSAMHELVQTIADETFACLFATPQEPIGEANWFSAWLTILGEEIVGVTMTREEWVSDLWVRNDSRRTGIGTRLLAHAEREIRGRGHHTLRLPVVKSNTQAVQFYQSQGWRVQRKFRHEKFGHAMLEMTKLGGQFRCRS